MIYTGRSKNSKGKMLVDARGTKIDGAYYFNDKTFEVRFFLPVKKGSRTNLVVSVRETKKGRRARVVKARAIIRGAKMVKRTKGK